MEKESVKKFDLEAAFKALDEIEIPAAEKGIKANRVDLKERFSHKSAHEALIEDYYDVSSNEDLEDAKDERDAEIAQAKLAKIEKIVDLDAESPEDLLPSYVGKVIIQCPQCMTLFYKNPEDIEHSDENPDVVNINEICQHCGNASGYTLVGKVGAVEEDETDQYTKEPAAEEESELDLNFEEPTKEVDAEGTGEGADEMSDEELAELDLDLKEIPEEESEEEPEEEKKEESLNLSKELKDAEEGSELKTKNESENLTLNEEVDKDLDTKLKAHNDYIAYLQQMIKQEEEALKKAENDEIKAAIQRRLDAFNADLEAALPDAVKEQTLAKETTEEPAEEESAKAQVEEEPKEEAAAKETTETKEEAPVDEALTEETKEEQPAEKQEEGTEINYVDYKHSYCHALAPKLKAINYLVNVKKAEVGLIKGYIKKLLKNPDVKWTDKEKDFIKNIEEKEDAYDILNYVKNSIEKAKTIKVKVDENGELIECLNEGFEGCLYEVLTESINNSEAQKDAEEHSELKTEHESEKLTLNENGDDATIASIINSWSFDDIEEDLNEGGAKAVKAKIASWTDEKPVEKACKNGECEKPLDECSKKSLKEEDEIPAEEEAPVEGTPAKEEKAVEEEPAEEPVNDEPAATENSEEVNFTAEEVKEVATDVAHAVSTPVEDEEEAEKQAEEIADVVDEKVDAAVEEKVEEANEAEAEEANEAEAEESAKAEEVEETEEVVEEGLTEANEAGLDKLLDSEEFQKPISDAEVRSYFDEAKKFTEDDIDDLDECSLNKHINEFLKEVYSNVKSYETTGCTLKENKLLIEGKIVFNSGKEKSTVFEFLPNYSEGKLFFEGINKDFSDNKAFTLNCSINKSKMLITESLGYKYKINETLVEGLK